MIACICLSPALDITYRVPCLAAGATNRVHAVTQRPGGKAVNVARVLHAFGEQVRVLAPAGGSTGAEFATALRSCGIGSELVPNAAPTRRTVTVVDESTGAATVLAEPAVLDCWAELLDRARALITDAQVVVVSGVAPRGVPDDALGTLVALARHVGRPVVIDSSGPGLRCALAAGPTVVKPNADELAQLSGDRDPVRAAHALARTYGTTVIASLAQDGLIAVSAQGAWRARPAAVLTGNPTGAGDALVAALALGLRDRVALPDLLTECVAMSAAAVLSAHAGEVDPRHRDEQRRGVVVDLLAADISAGAP